MNTDEFYDEVKAWINRVNEHAVNVGMHSNEFWEWVMRSSGKIAEKYNNHELVVSQMVMLVRWLEKVYFNIKGKGDEVAGN